MWHVYGEYERNRLARTEGGLMATAPSGLNTKTLLDEAPSGLNTKTLLDEAPSGLNTKALLDDAAPVNAKVQVSPAVPQVRSPLLTLLTAQRREELSKPLPQVSSMEPKPDVHGTWPTPGSTPPPVVEAETRPDSHFLATPGGRLVLAVGALGAFLWLVSR